MNQLLADKPVGNQFWAVVKSCIFNYKGGQKESE
jgi:hypothetical protein